jgi:hypothetical protein
MTVLIKYHTIQANPNHYWENNIVGRKLAEGKLTNYNDYIKACELAGCTHYNEERFNKHLEGK